MADYIDKKRFLSSLGLHGDETKYGNRDAEHQRRSYDTYMAYEVVGSVEDSLVEEELVPVVRCRDCKNGKTWKNAFGIEGFKCDLLCADLSPEAFCSYGVPKDGASDG